VEPTRLQQLGALGQSVWYDHLRRALLDSGELASLVGAGAAGVLSDPENLRRAILAGSEYDQALIRLAGSELEVLQGLVLEDAGNAADRLLPVYEHSQGLDGYLSLWLSPEVAENTQAIVAEASRLTQSLQRPNLMLEIPATWPACTLRALVASNSVNATLISPLCLQTPLGLHPECPNCWNRGPARVASLASIHLSDLDGKVDRMLGGLGADELPAGLLRGKSGIALARAVHAHQGEIYRRVEWSRLAEAGARIQRLLFRGMLPLDPALPETYYLQALVGPGAVTAATPDAFEVLLQPGKVEATLEGGLEGTQQRLEALAELGIDLGEVGRELQREQLAAARESWHRLLEAVADKRQRLAAGWRPLTAELGPLQLAAERAINAIAAQRVPYRIWARDHTVWKPDPSEIANRLGWLRAAEIMRAQIDRLEGLAAAFRADGYIRVVLLGMGGSSLTPDMFHRAFGVREGFPELNVLDTTDPGAIHDLAQNVDLERTAFLVSSKSGTTQETLSLFKFFYRRTVAAMGEWRGGALPGHHRPGTPLAALAERLHLRGALLNDPDLGGRYSALSYFGLVPAALIGLDLSLLLERAMQAASAAERWVPAAANPAAWLGTILAEAARQGRDKLTLLTSPGIESFGDWLEQLIAESTGKQGTGILPVVGEAPASPQAYGDDRLFVQLQLGEDPGEQAVLDQLRAAGHPVVGLGLRDRYDLGGQFFLWEMATAVAGHLLGINPFDQPNVEAAKAQARRIVGSPGALPEEQPVVEADGLRVFGGPPQPSSGVGEVIRTFLQQARPGAYLALQAYVHPTATVRSGLAALRLALRDRTRLATTQGFGPRYLHSTGQLHKGDAGKGLFLQLTAPNPLDLDIPDEPTADTSSLTFGALKAAQARAIAWPWSRPAGQ
jgi:transaldolase/glucose-6-phosphate isomerase